jgi:hypothetical protein
VPIIDLKKKEKSLIFKNFNSKFPVFLLSIINMFSV